MSPNDPSARKTARSRARTGSSAGGALRRLTGLFARSLGLDRDGAPRRGPGSKDGEADITQTCAELRTRLLGLSHDQAAEVMQHLVLVHDVLARRGWPGVAGLPGRVLARALVQAGILASEGKSPLLDAFVDNLRFAHVAAAKRDDDDAAVHEIRVGQNLEVTESTFAEYNDMERAWAGTVPSQLAPLDRAPARTGG